MDDIQKQLTAKLRGWHAESSNWPGEDSPSGREGGVTAKTCRTCRHTDPGCLMRIRGRRGLDCYYYEACETPLLVDELAEALQAIMDGLENGIFHGGYQGIPDIPDCLVDFYEEQWRPITNAAKVALVRHQEEVSDAQEAE